MVNGRIGTGHHLAYSSNVTDLLAITNMKGHYMVMDNVTIHIATAVRDLIEIRGKNA